MEGSNPFRAALASSEGSADAGSLPTARAPLPPRAHGRLRSSWPEIPKGVVMTGGSTTIKSPLGFTIRPEGDRYPAVLLHGRRRGSRRRRPAIDRPMKSRPFVVHTNQIRGSVYEVESGRLSEVNQEPPSVRNDAPKLLVRTFVGAVNRSLQPKPGTWPGFGLIGNQQDLSLQSYRLYWSQSVAIPALVRTIPPLLPR